MSTEAYLKAIGLQVQYQLVRRLRMLRGMWRGGGGGEEGERGSGAGWTLTNATVYPLTMWHCIDSCVRREDAVEKLNTKLLKYTFISILMLKFNERNIMLIYVSTALYLYIDLSCMTCVLWQIKHLYYIAVHNGNKYIRC